MIGLRELYVFLGLITGFLTGVAWATPWGCFFTVLCGSVGAVAGVIAGFFYSEAIDAAWLRLIRAREARDASGIRTASALYVIIWLGGIALLLAVCFWTLNGIRQAQRQSVAAPDPTIAEPPGRSG